MTKQLLTETRGRKPKDGVPQKRYSTDIPLASPLDEQFHNYYETISKKMKISRRDLASILIADAFAVVEESGGIHKYWATKMNTLWSQNQQEQEK